MMRGEEENCTSMYVWVKARGRSIYEQASFTLSKTLYMQENELAGSPPIAF